MCVFVLFVLFVLCVLCVRACVRACVRICLCMCVCERFEDREAKRGRESWASVLRVTTPENKLAAAAPSTEQQCHKTTGNATLDPTQPWPVAPVHTHPMRFGTVVKMTTHGIEKTTTDGMKVTRPFLMHSGRASMLLKDSRPYPRFFCAAHD